MQQMCPARAGPSCATHTGSPMARTEPNIIACTKSQKILCTVKHAACKVPTPFQGALHRSIVSCCTEGRPARGGPRGPLILRMGNCCGQGGRHGAGMAWGALHWSRPDVEGPGTAVPSRSPLDLKVKLPSRAPTCGARPFACPAPRLRSSACAPRRQITGRATGLERSLEKLDAPTTLARRPC